MQLMWRILAAVAVAMVLFPPFNELRGLAGAINRGYHFIFDPPARIDLGRDVPAYASVDVSMLLAQLAALGLVALFLWLGTKK